MYTSANNTNKTKSRTTHPIISTYEFICCSPKNQTTCRGNPMVNTKTDVSLSRGDETASAASVKRSLNSVLRDAATLSTLGVARASRSFLVAFLNMFVLVLGMIRKGGEDRDCLGFTVRSVNGALRPNWAAVWTAKTEMITGKRRLAGRKGCTQNMIVFVFLLS